MRIALYATLWFIASGYAILRGGEPERAGAACLLWLSAGIFIFRPFVALDLFALDKGAVIVDATALAALLVLALKANRTWPIWACSAQVVAVTAHLIRYLDLHEAPMAYALMFRAPSYLQCVVLIIGTRMYQLALQKGDSCSSWRTF